MSTKRTTLTYLLFLVCAAIPGLVLAQEEADPVINYYWNKARVAWEASGTGNAEMKYVVTATGYYMKVDSDGNYGPADSTVLNYYCTGSTVDSMKADSGEGQRFRGFQIETGDIFSRDYLISPFPNDTGGDILPIRFDTPAGFPDPTGFMIIDRYNGEMRWLYLNYPRDKEYRRLSRVYRFGEFHGFVFPDSVCEMGARDKLLYSEDYRIEMRITEVTLVTTGE